MSEISGFLYLNVANRWPGFRWRGLERGEDGALRLARVPLLPAPVAGLADRPAPDGPAGLAISPDGTLWLTDPGARRLLRVDPCDGSLGPVSCFGGEGDLPTLLREPRGLLWHPPRNLLIVADTGNDRLQLVHPETFHLVGVWGPFDAPTALATDGQGNVYVIESGARRVLQLDVDGHPIRSYEEGLERPVGVAVGTTEEGAVEIFVLDAGASPRIAVFDPEGTFLEPLELPAGDFLGFAFAEGSLYVGDNAGRRILRLLLDGTVVGDAESFEGPVAALAGDGRGGLWLHSGGTASPVRLDLAGGHVHSGVLWGGPFGTEAGRPVLWHEIETRGGPLAAGTHLRLFVKTGDAAPTPPSADPIAPFATGWTALPQDALRGLVRGTSAPSLWLGAHLTGEGRQSPVLEQIRVDYDTETWSRHLPAIYRTQAEDPELLERFLALFESHFTDLDEQIDRLPRLFDPAAAPVAWLPWLAGWLGLELDETWPEEKKRQAVSGAFAAAAKRGTPAGLREAVRFATGIDVRIAEPVLGATWWALPAGDEESPAGGRLGFDTVLAPVELGGAVVGTTALLDGSYLAGEEGLGAHLYESVAHQFCVQVFERQVASPRALAQVRAVVEREKPAHTAWHLCVIGARLRVGFQARLGVDTVIGGPAPARRLGASPELVLAGEPPGRLGEGTRLGTGTRLGHGVVEPSKGSTFHGA
ncbi:MAG TPA: phage tail protein I [Thermoanaerobaculia bacterium]|nr:phage tail protein I [Thermoanaerobaculia bacterium]